MYELRKRAYYRKNNKRLKAYQKGWNERNKVKLVAYKEKLKAERRTFEKRPHQLYQSIKERLAKGKSYKGRKLLFTKEQLTEFCLLDVSYRAIFKEWEASGFRRQLSPSVDRINNDGDYSLDNIQILTHADNGRKGSSPQPSSS